MRIGIVASSGSPWSYSVLEILSELGAEIDLIHVAPEKGRAYIDPDSVEWRDRVSSLHNLVRSVTTPDLPSGLRRYPALAQAIKDARVRQSFPQLLTLYGGGFAASAALSGIPFSSYLVGSDVLTASRFHQMVSKFSLRKADHLFANGAFLTQEAAILCGSTPIQNLLLGINVDHFEVGIPATDKPIRIICSRGFSKVYNNETIIRALSKLDDIADLFRFDFAAGGDLLTEGMDLAEEILPSRVRSSVHFHGGMSQTELSEMLRVSEVFVSMSRSDGTSTSLLEALCSGLYPILSDIPANRDWVDFPDGQLVPVEDSEALATAIRTAVNHRLQLVQHREERSKSVKQIADSRKNLKLLLEALA